MNSCGEGDDYSQELIDELLKDYQNPQDILAEGGLLKQLTKAIVERCLETEMETHLGYNLHRYYRSRS